jgi:hypothetical protein
MRTKYIEVLKSYTMGFKNFKALVTTISAAFASVIYTKKRIQKENKLKTVHSKNH